MTANQIRSEKVRSIITGSAMPATDILALHRWGELTAEEIADAAAYFAPLGISDTAHAEHEHVKAMDC